MGKMKRSGGDSCIESIPTDCVVSVSSSYISSVILLLGVKGSRIRALTSVVPKLFKFPENSVELYAEKGNNRGFVTLLRLSLSVTSSLATLQLGADGRQNFEMSFLNAVVSVYNIALGDSEDE
ncbi:hypothetical protein LIER_04772 [Lithospermum erythrorhizon]|uniref:Uncharacterized protein n=1 Tax=Lithospermum erythrorhizon TaxID=34254 RepID=A0AAV3NXX8_LITER